MIVKETESLKWFEFKSLNVFKNLKHGVLTRLGGYSKKPFDSLNLNLVFDENKPDLIKNLSKVKKVLDLSNIVWANQVHGTNIIEINFKNIDSKFQCDGFVTQEKNIALFIKHADCQAAIFYDPIKKVIGNIHCGWKGNVLNIYQKAIEKMTNLYSCDPKNILVCISPSLGPESSEFMNYKKEFPKYFWPFQIKENYFDLWAISKRQLLDLGILENHIEIAKINTYDCPNDFFSYRRDHITGRNATFISL